MNAPVASGVGTIAANSGHAARSLRSRPFACYGLGAEASVMRAATGRHLSALPAAREALSETRGIPAGGNLAMYRDRCPYFIAFAALLACHAPDSSRGMEVVTGASYGQRMAA